ncbi:MAG: hypothetical protein Q8O43_06345 [Dehalococcoidia bacterium]|nr:hypothetical protein [Dehalococcoidia bacterium]
MGVIGGLEVTGAVVDVGAGGAVVPVGVGVGGAGELETGGVDVTGVPAGFAAGAEHPGETKTMRIVKRKAQVNGREMARMFIVCFQRHSTVA